MWWLSLVHWLLALKLLSFMTSTSNRLCLCALRAVINVRNRSTFSSESEWATRKIIGLLAELPVKTNANWSQYLIWLMKEIINKQLCSWISFWNATTVMAASLRRVHLKVLLLPIKLKRSSVFACGSCPEDKRKLHNKLIFYVSFSIETCFCNVSINFSQQFCTQSLRIYFAHWLFILTC